MINNSMTINRDTRLFPQDEPIQFQADKITFYELRITGNRASNIEDMVKGNYYFVGKKTEKVDFSECIQIYDMQGNCFVVKYTNKITRDNDIQLLKQHFQKEGMFAKKREAERQIPDFEGYFDYDGKYYTIVDGLNALTDEISSQR